MSVLPSRLRSRRAVVAITAVALLALTVAAAAQAHAFLIRSDPEAGARLGRAPARLTLYFSERFVAGSERLTIDRASGGGVSLPRPQTQASVVVQPLPAKLTGIFVVHWRVLSDDGHVSLGEFAFAVGSTAALPQLKATSNQTPASQVVASWLFFVGLALAFGGLVSERFIWARRELPPRGTPPVLAGVAIASLAALAELILIAGGRAGGGFGAGLKARALGAALGTRPGTLTLVVLAALAAAAAAAARRGTRLLALPALLAAIVATSLRGHSGTSGHAWAVVADAVHLAGVALWVGALFHLVLVAAGRREGETVDIVAGVRRYAGLALVTTLVVISSGVVTALAEFRGVGDLTSTGYGRTLIVKAGLVGLALALALTARLRALSANPAVRLPLLRLLTRAEAAALAAALVAVALLVNVAPPRGAATAATAATRVLGPPPLPGRAVRLADLAGQLVAGLAATERELEFTIVAPTHTAASGSTLKAEAQPSTGKSVDLYPRPCGDGCFVIRYRLQRGTTTIRADVGAPGWKGGKVRFAVPWPLKPPADALLRRVTKTMTALPQVVLTEAVTSGPGSGGRPATYTLTGRAFVATELYRSGAVDVRNLGRRNGLTELAFAFPGSTIWYRIWVDDHDRIRREMIISTGHLIRRVFRYGKAAGASAPTQTYPTPNPRGGVPSPPTPAVVFGKEDGDLGVGLAVRIESAGLELQTSVLDPSGGGTSGLDVGYRVRTTSGAWSATASDCGGGCYRARVAATGKPTLVRVRIAGAGRRASIATFALPRLWPAPAAAALAARATRVFRNLTTLVIHERLASSETNALTTTYEIVAPDRLAYQIVGGSQAIVIGDRRWDREPRGDWKESPQYPIHPMTPAWTGAQNAHLIGAGRVGGRAVWIISFYDPRIPGFFTIAIEKATLRTLELHMTASAHFMHHRYGGFNAPIKIAPPR